MYEVQYAGGYKTAMVANAISNDLLSQLDQYGQHFVLFEGMIYHRTYGAEIKEEDAFIHIVNGNK